MLILPNMDPLQKADISRISNNEIMKDVFSYLNSKRILKIVQKNKNLQKKLGINIEYYKNKSDLPKYEYFEKKATYYTRKKKGHELGLSIHFCLITCCTSIYFIYTLIYAILLVAKDTFDESNTKENYDKSLENKISTFNKCMFILVTSVIISWLALVFFVFKNCYRDYGIKRIIKSVILIIIILLHISFEGLVISKLVFSYKIKKDGSTWFIVMDYIFLVLNFIHIALNILNTIAYFHDGGTDVEHITQCALISFNNVKIENFELPDNFRNWKKKERKRFISDNYINYELLNSDNIGINMYLNMVKRKYDIPNFEINQIKSIPDFIIEEPGEMMLYPDRNIFKLSNEGYIFRYPIGEFVNILRKNSDDTIKNILSKDNLTFYQVINQNEKQIIYVFGEPKNKYLYDKFKNMKRRQREHSFGHLILNDKISGAISSTRNNFIE